MNSIKLKVCSKAENVQLLSCRVLSFIQSRLENISESDLFDLRVILNELIVNAVFHGNGCNENKCVILGAEVNDGRTVKLTVEDEGTGFDYIRVLNEECGDQENAGYHGCSDKAPDKTSGNNPADEIRQNNPAEKGKPGFRKDGPYVKDGANGKGATDGKDDLIGKDEPDGGVSSKCNDDFKSKDEGKDVSECKDVSQCKEGSGRIGRAPVSHSDGTDSGKDFGTDSPDGEIGLYSGDDDLAWMSECGRGLRIVKSLCDSIEFNSCGNKVVVVKKCGR